MARTVPVRVITRVERPVLTDGQAALFATVQVLDGKFNTDTEYRETYELFLAFLKGEHDSDYA